MSSTKKIKDKFTKLKLSRQRKYQLRMLEQGRCPVCGKKATGYFCEKHAVQNRERERVMYKRKKRWINSKSYKFKA